MIIKVGGNVGEEDEETEGRQEEEDQEVVIAPRKRRQTRAAAVAAAARVVRLGQGRRNGFTNAAKHSTEWVGGEGGSLFEMSEKFSIF